ncbi:MAG TPA: hypothetical protein VFC99_21600 [Acidimicrobiia bacterium]|nr:hypothetical protein [Acidimicrobiia bacterium]
MSRPPEHPNGSWPPPGSPDWAARQRTLRNIWTIRWVLMGLSVLLAIALLASGAVLIGVLLLAIVAVRVTMMVMWQRRRREFRQRRNRPGPGSS